MTDRSRIYQAFLEVRFLPHDSWHEHLERRFPGEDTLHGEVMKLQVHQEAADEVIAASSRDASLPEGMRIGNYEILRPIGEGGAGTVYAAAQRSPLKRTVAIKVLRRGVLRQDELAESLSRFRREQKALAAINHPNVAQVYDAGSTDGGGNPYLVMELVSGLPITVHCDTNGLSIRERLELLVQACRAVEHAHTRGVIHRDLKPTNLLVTEENGGALVKLIDFGIAKTVGSFFGELTFQTAVGRVMGTPWYMSPEQISGDAAAVDRRSDVFSLGAVLYELLVGETPLTPESVARSSAPEIQRRICEEMPDPPSTRFRGLKAEIADRVAAARATTSSRIARALEGDLDRVVLKALYKDPAQRYQSAGEFGDDLERFLRGQPVLARPPSLAYRARKLIGRYKVAFALGALAVFALVTATAVSLVFAAIARRSEQVVSEQRDELLAGADFLRLQELRGRIESVGLVSTSMIPELEVLLEEMEEVAARLPFYERTLSSIRDRADRIVPDIEELAREPDILNEPGITERLERIRLNETLVSELATEHDCATVFTAFKEREDPARTVYFRQSFNLPEIVPEARLRLSYQVDDGAVFFLNGSEVLRTNMPEAPVEHETFSKSMTTHPLHGEEPVVLDGAPLAAGTNIIAASLHQCSGHALDAYFDVSLTLVTPSGKEDTLIAWGATWRYASLPPTAWKDESLAQPDEWQEGCAPFGCGFYQGPGLAAELRHQLARDRAELEAFFQERRWRFSDPEVQSRHDTIARLIADLRSTMSAAKGPVAQLRYQIQRARHVYRETVEKHGKKWQEAIASIADPNECPAYRGLRITPQEGLIPLRRNPSTGLWEFTVYEVSGALSRPGVRADGTLEITGDTGIVLVLIPPGAFQMGDSENPRIEGPVHEVDLDAFFLSKYEMTQGQWIRLAGLNPSVHSPPRGNGVTLAHPMENVSWFACKETLGNAGLVLPTEAQWEYAARAGSSTQWWTGDDKASLEGAANLFDASATTLLANFPFSPAPWDDGFTMHAPVGSFRANAFGLYDTAGNVWEWCADWHGSYELPVREGDGARLVPEHLAARKAGRGGGWKWDASYLRSAYRGSDPPEFFHNALGVRPARPITKSQ